MRDNKWLEIKLEEIWAEHFADVERKNQIHISFGRRARKRLGYIKWLDCSIKNSPTTITLNGFFKEERVPETVLKITIAHELCHYTHGFCSPLPKLYEYPHADGVVDKELAKRNLSNDLKYQTKWMNENWLDIASALKPRRRRLRARRTVRLSFGSLIKGLISANHDTK